MPESTSGKEKISGIIENITYKNEQNAYTVATVKCGKEKITAVGFMPFAADGDKVNLFGHFTVHHSYGEQFAVDNFERAVPESSAAILRYLSSGAIKGIGPGTASKIVEKFKDKTLQVLENSPEDLSSIRGISLEKAYGFSEEYKKQYGVQELVLLLSPYGIGIEKCARIFKRLGKDAAEKIKNNPYVLCSDYFSVSFEKAEAVSSDLNLPQDSCDRVCAGIIYVLKRNLMNGHTCLPADKLCAASKRLLGLDDKKISDSLNLLKEQLALLSCIKDGQEFIALPEQFYAEQYISARMKAVKQNLDKSVIIDDLEIDYVENKVGIKFESMQRLAIKQTFESGILILTGGPGTGKTTTLNAIIQLFENRDISIALAAPTGRAAKRMSELTGREAKTIHRLLEVEWGADDEQHFARNEKNPLDCDVIIIDEASMIDSLLFSALLKALKLKCRMVIVGDADQLPSVSAGNVLNDLLMSGRFASIKLNKVFRQAQKSLIVTNAHAIINNGNPDLSSKNGDFFFLERGSENSVCNTVLELADLRLPKAYGFDPVKDIQILCPSRMLDCGCVNLNNLLQGVLNPEDRHKSQLSYKGVYFRTGDKVMQIKNNYDIIWKKQDNETGSGVFNGDIGLITDVDVRAGIITVLFDDRTVTYFKEQLDEIELAYAVTVHKSQGSEFDCVILPLFDIPEKLKYRNLLYTAITRAKKLLVIVGKKQIFIQMAENNRKTLRYTLLKDLLCDE